MINLTASGFAGADWIRANYNCNMSALGIAVADLLGDLYEGIYHLANSATQKADWSNAHRVSVVLRTEMATIDNNLLTRLVILCHDRMLRANIQPVGPGYMRICFSFREKRDGRLYERCPTIEDHIAQIRAYYAPKGGTTCRVEV